MDFFNRKRREERETHVPPPPPPELEERIREVEITAELQRSEAQAREPDIEKRSQRSTRIKRDNALGPRFWQAVGEPKT